MQVILMEKLPNLGQLGDIVKVKPGYARNYLIPQGKAKRATEANVAEFQQRRAELEKAQGEILTAAQAHAAKLEGLLIQVTQKAGVDGRLFGSVTNYDISEALKAQGFEVPKGCSAAAAWPAQTGGRIRDHAGPAYRREGAYQSIGVGRAVSRCAATNSRGPAHAGPFCLCDARSRAQYNASTSHRARRLTC